METLKQMIKAYKPVCQQELADREQILSFMEKNPDCLQRSSLSAHFTASAWIVNSDRSKVLMVYHNIYDSWSWTGGHADGEADLLAVAMREAKEETGIFTVKPVVSTPVSLEILTVDGHMKRGAYVSSHLHLNLTFLLEADETEPLQMKADENSGVRWIETNCLKDFVSEKWMLAHIYSKLI